MPLGKIATLGLAAIAVLWAPDALAANPIGDLFSGGVKTGIVVIGSIVIAIASFFSFLFATLIGSLMGSAYILDSGVAGTLELVWTILRNFTNYFLTLIVLIIALMAVMGIGGDENDGISMIKKSLPKIMLAIVVVNFTWFGARMVLTVNDILATAVFSLPGAVWQGEARPLPCGGDGENCLEKARTTLASEGTNFDEKLSSFMKDAYVGADATATGLIQRDNFALALLSQMLDLKQIMTVNVQLNSAWGATVSTLGVMITTLITAFIFFFLMVSFIIRMVMLWVLIAISPLAVLLAIFKDTIKIPLLDQIDFMGNFLKYAFFPAAVAFPLSVGMIMIFSGNSFTSLGHETDAINAMLAGDVFAFLWWAAAIGIIWVGTKKTIETFAPIADGMVSGTYDFVNAAGKGAIGSLKYAPIFPVPGADGPLSLAGIQSAKTQAIGKLEGVARANARPLASSLAGLVRDDTNAPPDTASFNAALEKGAENVGDLMSTFETLTANGAKLDGALSSAALAANNKTLEAAGMGRLADGATHADVLRRIVTHGGTEAARAEILLKSGGHSTEEGVEEDAGGGGASGTPFDIHITNITNLSAGLTDDVKIQAVASSKITTILQQIHDTTHDGKTGADAVKAAGKADALIGALDALKEKIKDASTIEKIQSKIESLED